MKPVRDAVQVDMTEAETTLLCTLMDTRGATDAVIAARLPKLWERWHAERSLGYLRLRRKMRRK